jgi:hypothetical protein
VAGWQSGREGELQGNVGQGSTKLAYEVVVVVVY